MIRKNCASQIIPAVRYAFTIQLSAPSLPPPPKHFFLDTPMFKDVIYTLLKE